MQYVAPDTSRRTKQGFKTKDAAQAWADKNAVDTRTGDWIDPNLSTTTVATIGDKWLTMQSHLKPSTLNLNTGIWETRVKPHWGNVRVGSVQHSDVQAWVSGMGMSASWARSCHNVLAQVLDLAVADRMLRENPARGVKLPRKTHTVKVYWTMEQLRAFARECEDREDLILLLGTSGLRWGESIALRPRDLDPLRNRIHVTRNAAKVGNGIVLGTPKTHERRTVAVAQNVMDMLVARSKSVEPDGLLWEAKRGGWLRSPGHNSWFDGAMKRAMKEDPALERVTPHGLRHVAAGLLVNAGANVLAVSRQLGHANPSITLNTYAELFDDGLDLIAATLDDGFADRGEIVDSGNLGT